MNPSGHSDQELIRAIQSGDPQAFETIYHRYRDWIVSIAFRFCGNPDDALDVLQETFAYLFKKLPGFELRSQMKTFLYPVVKHLALDRKALARRHTSAAPTEDLPAAAAGGGDLGDLLVDLTDDQRETVRLRFADGLSLQEIAQAMGVPLGTVKSRLHAALEILRKKNF